MNVLAELDANVNDNPIIDKQKPTSTKSLRSRTSRTPRNSKSKSRRSSARSSTSTNLKKSSFILPSDDDEDEDYDTAVGIKKNSRPSRICFDDDSDEDDYDEGYLSPLEADGTTPPPSSRRPPSFEKRKSHPDSHKKTAKKTPNPKPRKRRRSSARFLRLSGRFDNAENREEPEQEPEKLGEMYRQAIRLNAENKINVGNSWGLKLIENIDKFLGDEDEEEHGDATMKASHNRTTSVAKEQRSKQGGAGGEKRVNFTKASCTLDASVKIYSYRVDDVHLTSYKVLANLNRTDGGATKKSNSFENNLNDYDDDRDDGDKSRKSIMKSGKRSIVDTIESNPGKEKSFDLVFIILAKVRHSC